VKFNPTRVPNLLRAENGIYYARIVYGGRQHWKSLKTKVESIAKQKLRVQEETVRGRKVAKGTEMTFGMVAEVYAAQVKLERLAESTKEFRLRPAATLKRTWPELWAMDIRHIGSDDCVAWQRRFENGLALYRPTRAKKTVRGDSPTVVNAILAYLRRVFEISIKEGLRSDNPALAMQRKPIRHKLMDLPSKTQFAEIVARVRSSAFRGNNSAADLIEGLAYSGMRLKEASHLAWTDVNFEAGRMAVRGTKTATSSRIVPLTPAMTELLSRVRRKGPQVFRARSALGCLRTACKAVKVKTLTHHDLRHYYATCCIEAGVDIPTVSRWLGHSDGGALAMKTYGHLRASHSTEAAAKVTF
jgi:integrase